MPDDILQVIKPLIDIANAYDANNLDDEARKTWGDHHNRSNPASIHLYGARGGATLLTLQDCLDARTWARERGMI